MHIFSSVLAIAAALIAAKEAKEFVDGDAGALDGRSLIAIGVLCAVAGALVFFANARPPRSVTGKPVLAVDMDEVCVGYVSAFIEYSNAKHGTKLEVNDFTSYMFWEVPSAKLKTREEAVERVYDFHESKYFRQLEPFPNAKIGLDVLKRSFELHVVTSRQSDIEPLTRAFVAKFFPDVFTEVHFGNHFGKTGAKVSKPEICKRIGATALIDDSMDYAKQCAAAGLPVFLFGDYPWNQLRANEAPLDAKITRVSGWRMAAQLISPQVVEAMAVS